MNRCRNDTGQLVTVVPAQGNLAWISWDEKCSIGSLQNNMTEVTRKVWVGSKCGPQNKNIIFSSNVFNLRCLHWMNSILVAGALRLMSSRIMNHELVCGLCGWAWPKGYRILHHFFFPKPCFLEFIWIFSGTNDLKINNSHILNPNLTKKNSIKYCSSPAFQQHQRHIPVPPKLSGTI